jgi:hypothetical protein
VNLDEKALDFLKHLVGLLGICLHQPSAQEGNNALQTAFHFAIQGGIWRLGEFQEDFPGPVNVLRAGSQVTCCQVPSCRAHEVDCLEEKKIHTLVIDSLSMLLRFLDDFPGVRFHIEAVPISGAVKLEADRQDRKGEEPEQQALHTQPYFMLRLVLSRAEACSLTVAVL